MTLLCGVGAQLALMSSCMSTASDLFFPLLLHGTIFIGGGPEEGVDSQYPKISLFCYEIIISLEHLTRE